MASDAPTDNLLRAWVDPEAIEFRAAADGEAGDVMTGHFAVFNRWTKIDSWYEGKFMERLAPGSFADTLASSRAVKVLYDHGADPAIGNKPLGSIRSLAEDKKGVRYEVDLLDTEYVNQLKPAIRANLLGASFRFRVTAEEWNQQPKRSKDNPEGLPERTITGVELYEFGPVTFPAYADATAGMRSGTDAYMEALMRDKERAARFFNTLGGMNTAEFVAALPIAGRNAAGDEEKHEAEEPAAGRSDAPTQDARARWMRSRQIA